LRNLKRIAQKGYRIDLDDFGTGLNDVYGLCTYLSDSGAYVFINDTDGKFEQYLLDTGGATPRMELVREFVLPSQPEGCVADRETRRVYLGEEGAGIWAAGAEPDGEAPRLVIGLSSDLVADVEGMSIYRSETRALLVVSSQGSDSFAVYDLDSDYALVASFVIAANIAAGIDGVSETDGLAVSAVPLPAYPQGILIVQDGRNRIPDAPQNFKIVDWRAVQSVVDGVGQ
ncbi:MAG: phytase, partial [Pseudomonadota bacterium]